MIINRSRVETFNACNRRYYWMYVRNLIKPRISKALRTGSALHRFWEAWYGNIELPREQRMNHAVEIMHESLKEWRPDVLIDLEAQYEQQLEAECDYLAEQYVNRYGPSEAFAVLRPEVVFDVPLGANHRLKGQTDAVVTESNQFWLLEHKTAGQFGDSFMEKFMLNHQVVSYVYGISKQLGVAISGVIVNAIRKPQERKIPITSIPLGPESFHRERMLVTKDHIADMLSSFSYIASDIASRSLTNKEEWPLDTNRCHDYGKCPFWDICAHGADAEVGPLYIERRPDYVDDPKSKHMGVPVA